MKINITVSKKLEYDDEFWIGRSDEEMIEQVISDSREDPAEFFNRAEWDVWIER